MDDVNLWWEKELTHYREEGARDADKGYFCWPCLDEVDDPANSDLNAAYKEGFDKRRKELGNKFKWA